MGEIADDLIDRMWEDGGTFHDNRGFVCRRGRNNYKQEPRKPRDPRAFDEETCAREYTGKKTPAHLVPDFPEKTFDMSFFPKAPEPVKQPTIQDLIDGDAPF